MLSTLLSNHRPAWFIVGIFALIEVLTYVLPIHYGLEQGAFLSNHRRILMESSSPCYDYIIFGDSRSLSLNGKESTDSEPYSVYNLSVPAMDPRYFAQYFRKYMSNRDCAPRALIFAGSPGMFDKHMARPVHDPDQIYSNRLDEELSSYVIRRVGQRLDRPFRKPEREPTRFSNLLWEAFSHRYLQTFSMTELASIYTGPERVFVLREAFPLLYQTYRYRKAIETFSADFTLRHFEDPQIPEQCSQCSVLENNPICHPSMTNVQENRLIDKVLDQNRGGINLADRFEPDKRIAYNASRDEWIERDRQWQDAPDRTVRLEPLVDLIQTAREFSTPTVIIIPPPIDALYDTQLVDEYRAAMQKLVDDEWVYFVPFPEPAYPRELFLEQVHYSCDGAARLNQDFKGAVLPEIQALIQSRD